MQQSVEQLLAEEQPIVAANDAAREEQFMRKFIIAFAAMAVIASPGYSAACRDSHGKFIKCAHAAVKKPVRCKDAKGKFARCGAPGTHPA